MSSTTRIDRLIQRLLPQLRSGASYQTSPTSSKTDRSVPVVSRGVALGSEAAAIAAVEELLASGVTDERTLVSCYLEQRIKAQLGAELVNEGEFQLAMLSLVELLQGDSEAWALCLACIER